MSFAARVPEEDSSEVMLRFSTVAVLWLSASAAAAFAFLFFHTISPVSAAARISRITMMRTHFFFFFILSPP